MNIDALMTVLSWVGIFTVAACVIMMSYFAFDALQGVVHGWRWQYKYKHRFDKPPTAKCYCKDCLYHTTKDSSSMGPCGWHGISRWTPDNGFCYEAKPMTRKEAEKRGKAD